LNDNNQLLTSTYKKHKLREDEILEALEFQRVEKDAIILKLTEHYENIKKANESRINELITLTNEL
jgi:hypothetical protein